MNPDTMKTENETARAVADLVAAHFCVTYEELISKRRFQYLTKPRRIIFTILYKELHWGFTKIGAMFKRDHATIIHLLKTQRNLMWAYKDVKGEYETLRDKALAQFHEIANYGAINARLLNVFRPIIISDLAPVSCVWTHLKGVSI